MRRIEQAGVFQRLLGGGGGELAVDARMLPAAGVGDEAAKVEVLDLGGELRRKAVGVEAVDRPDAAAALQLGVVHGVHAVAQRRDRAHAGDDNSSSHNHVSGQMVSRSRASVAGSAPLRLHRLPLPQNDRPHTGPSG